MDPEEPIEQYNSDSGEGDFGMDDMISDDDNGGGRGAGNGEAEGVGAQGWINWFCSLEGHEYMV